MITERYRFGKIRILTGRSSYSRRNGLNPELAGEGGSRASSKRAHHRVSPPRRLRCGNPWRRRDVAGLLRRSGFRRCRPWRAPSGRLRSRSTSHTLRWVGPKGRDGSRARPSLSPPGPCRMARKVQSCPGARSCTFRTIYPPNAGTSACAGVHSGGRGRLSGRPRHSSGPTSVLLSGGCFSADKERARCEF